MMRIEEPYFPLDSIQENAAANPIGPVVIYGGPGTGKTRTLVARIIKLLNRDVEPETITCITHKSRGSYEVRRQLSALFNVDDIFTGTMQDYATFLLREYGAEWLGRSPEYTVWDRRQAGRAIANIAKADPDEYPITKFDIQNLLHWRSRNQARYADDRLLPAAKDFWHKLVRVYDTEKQFQNVFDLDDLVPVALELLSRYPDIQNHLRQGRTRHVLVDEYEEVTPRQFELLGSMLGPERSITIALDFNQSIHMRRGADFTLIQRFMLRFPTRDSHLLYRNQRHTQALNEISDTLTSEETMTGLESYDKDSIRLGGPPPAVLDYPGSKHQMASFIIDKTAEAVEDGQRWEDFAFIYRDPSTSAAMINQLEKRGIPYRKLGDNERPLESDAQLVINLLTSVLNPLDIAAFFNAGSTRKNHTIQGIDTKVAEKITAIASDNQLSLMVAAKTYVEDYAKPNTKVSQALSYLIGAWETLYDMLEGPQVTLTELLSRAHQVTGEAQPRQPGPIPQTDTDLTYLATLCDTNHRLGQSTTRKRLAHFLDLVHNHDGIIPNHGVTLSTIHDAKGLHWHTVWIVGAGDQVVPRQAQDDNFYPSKISEEEQRIFYVAVTRATDKLYFCTALDSTTKSAAKRSRFIDLLEKEGPLPRLTPNRGGFPVASERQAATGQSNSTNENSLTIH